MNWLRTFVSSLIVSLSCVSMVSANDLKPAIYSVTPESWAPYWIVSDDKVEGVLSDLMVAIDQRLPQRILPNDPVPVKRALHAFSRGEIQIECCVNKAWRQQPEQASVSLWSDTVMVVEEVLIFPVGKAFPFKELEDLKGKSLATILGYGYVGDEYFKRYDVLKNSSLIKMVAMGRVDAAIIDRSELDYALEHYAELERVKNFLDIGPVINRSELKVRVHQSRPELVPLINDVVKEMQKENKIKSFLKAYLGDM